MTFFFPRRRLAIAVVASLTMVASFSTAAAPHITVTTSTTQSDRPLDPNSPAVFSLR